MKVMKWETRGGRRRRRRGVGEEREEREKVPIVQEIETEKR